ncbi:MULTISPECIES: helix-turn-helix transcriptional regulator [unclassified Mesorhizobium]|uniref:helix-turn-helix domain-containing protein n=1 Tax=unclassified Mesorhizobium TaxID=325217 RepID=UPI001093A4FD|nr:MULTISPECIES: helix-turn-helix transcriptional regulator [unclassified Mesorhizobium]TGT91234.1 XRE family transcriptional regulator [Mesorhizobium sp. M8A.F.Ca.ET.161.01.1.1]TGV43486.1 XRE family transcriptional regulator [Mesorhizobium sp. M8A.F.Ca.ET.142.01.1.1]
MPTKRSDSDKIVESSGNVFRDLGIELTPEEAVKVDIARAITRVIAARDYTQKDVAVILGTDQAKVSNIVRGRLEAFSMERLIRYLLALGINVDVHLSQTKDRRKVLPIGKDQPVRPDEGRVKVHTSVAACG